MNRGPDVAGRSTILLLNMKAAAKVEGPNHRTAGRKKSKHSGQEDIEQYLAQILVNVAHLLLQNGYEYRRFNRLARQAFVDAAMSVGYSPKSRPSIASIAAVTGLTRIEVSQLRRSTSNQRNDERAPLNRAIKVATAWSSDKNFATKRKGLLRLPFSKGPFSFSKLVQKYSGDIPARAMLVEMKRLGMVREIPRDIVELTRNTIHTKKPTLAAMRAISPWVSFIGSAGAARSGEELTSVARQICLNFESLPQVYAAVREIEERRASFVAGLELLGTHAKKSAEYRLTVSVAVAAKKPLRAKQVTQR